MHASICKTYWVMVLHTSMLDWRRKWGKSAMGICAFCYMCNFFSVIVFHRSLVNWRRGALVYVHAAICETFLV